MATPEGQVKAMISRALKPWIDRGEVWKLMPVPSLYSSRSIDYILCAGGRFIGIEAKKPGGKPTALQIETMRRIREAGGLTFVVDDEESLADVMRVIRHCVALAPAATKAGGTAA